MSAYKILYAEDDETLGFLTRDSLTLHGFDVCHCADGVACLEAFHNNHFDLCILDIMMPGMDGFSVAGSIRKKNQDIPVIFLSAKTLKEDRLKGLRIGADDYLIKPFNMEELILKIEVFLSRSKKTKGTEKMIYQAGAFRFDPANFLLSREQEQIVLTQKEAALLQFFLDNRNTVLKREQILTAIWGQDDFFFGRSLDVFISRLRKIFSGEETIKIETLHGIGFKWVDTGKNDR